MKSCEIWLFSIRGMTNIIKHLKIGFHKDWIIHSCVIVNIYSTRGKHAFILKYIRMLLSSCEEPIYIPIRTYLDPSIHPIVNFICSCYVVIKESICWLPIEMTDWSSITCSYLHDWKSFLHCTCCTCIVV